MLGIVRRSRLISIVALSFIAASFSVVVGASPGSCTAIHPSPLELRRIAALIPHIELKFMGLTYQTLPAQPINDAYSTSDLAGDHEFHNLLAEPPPNPHRFIMRG